LSQQVEREDIRNNHENQENGTPSRYTSLTLFMPGFCGLSKTVGGGVVYHPTSLMIGKCF